MFRGKSIRVSLSPSLPPLSLFFHRTFRKLDFSLGSLALPLLSCFLVALSLWFIAHLCCLPQALSLSLSLYIVFPRAFFSLTLSKSRPVRWLIMPHTSYDRWKDAPYVICHTRLPRRVTLTQSPFADKHTPASLALKKGQCSLITRCGLFNENSNLSVYTCKDMLVDVVKSFGNFPAFKRGVPAKHDTNTSLYVTKQSKDYVNFTAATVAQHLPPITSTENSGLILSPQQWRNSIHTSYQKRCHKIGQFLRYNGVGSTQHSGDGSEPRNAHRPPWKRLARCR
ncbi:unnamed protein product [Ectocarpus sp. 8 AP-2014]